METMHRIFTQACIHDHATTVMFQNLIYWTIFTQSDFSDWNRIQQ